MTDKPKNYTVGMVIIDKAKGHKKDTAEDLLGMIERQIAKQKLNAKSTT